MIHPLVTQLWFTRSEFVRCFDGVSDEEARRRIQSMNCLSWMIGHLAEQEQRFWVIRAQGREIVPGLQELSTRSEVFGYFPARVSFPDRVGSPHQALPGKETLAGHRAHVHREEYTKTFD